MRFIVSVVVTGLVLCVVAHVDAEDRLALAGTMPLTFKDDPASRLVTGVDTFLLRKLADSKRDRQQRWEQALTESTAVDEIQESRRQQLAEILGLRDERAAFDSPDFIGSPESPSITAGSDSIRIYRLRWPVLTDPDPKRSDLASVHGEGLLLVPTREIRANVVAIPDADQTPEQLCGLSPGIPLDSQYALRLAQSGCRVVIPTIVSRREERRNDRVMLSDREYLYRSATVLGQQLAGIEVQKVLAVVDWFAADSTDDADHIGVVGYGEGGMLALFAGALDPRIHTTAVSGYFGPREASWNEPLDRNLFGLLREFGAAQLAAMVAPRKLRIEASAVPPVKPGGNGSAPAQLVTPTLDEIQSEIRLATQLTPGHLENDSLTLVVPSDGEFGSDEWIRSIHSDLTQQSVAVPQVKLPSALTDVDAAAEQRRRRQVNEIDRHNQLLLREAPFVRREFMARLDTSSPETYAKSVEPYRDIFRDEVIGQFDDELLPFNARSRQIRDTEKWTAYEIWLDVFPDVGAYGILLLPKDLQPGERRPVVVCQHGLEGRPLDTIENDHPAYHDYAAKLCERGYITFAPQNLYIFEDRFRTLQRKANPLGCSLFSIMVPQHQQIVNWLKSQPFVDGNRIAFYGLSYGGKSAMRIPALVTDYCLSICSADFNEWVVKNASTRHDFSYVWTGEYEIFEWNLGRTFNYAEMAAMICPRPFMVERGHFDGVGADEWVAYEYAKVRHLYAAKLGIPERTQIEWFVGPHTINGQGTFDFLDRHLQFQTRTADEE